MNREQEKKLIGAYVAEKKLQDCVFYARVVDGKVEIKNSPLENGYKVVYGNVIEMS